MSHKQFSPENWERLVNDERHERMSVAKFFGVAEPKNFDVWTDIGCGPGYFTLPLAERVQKVIAVDISEKMLDICRQRAQEKGLENIDYLKVLENQLGLDDDSVDRILLANVFHEFDERDTILDELYRILKANGLVYIIDWKCQEMDVGPPLEHRLPEKQVISDMAAHGFSLDQSWAIYHMNYVLAFCKRKIENN